MSYVDIFHRLAVTCIMLLDSAVFCHDCQLQVETTLYTPSLHSTYTPECWGDDDPIDFSAQAEEDDLFLSFTEHEAAEQDYHGGWGLDDELVEVHSDNRARIKAFLRGLN